MVGTIGSAAQQISSNLTKLKASTNSQNANLDVDLDQDASHDAANNSTASSTSTNLSSRVSQGLVRLQKTSADGSPEEVQGSLARNGVDVELSKEARALLNTS